MFITNIEDDAAFKRAPGFDLTRTHPDGENGSICTKNRNQGLPQPMTNKAPSAGDENTASGGQCELHQPCLSEMRLRQAANVGVNHLADHFF